MFGLGNLRDAETSQRRALEIQNEVLPKPHPDLALSLNNLANILQVQGRLDQAQPYYRDTLAMQRILLHANHPDLATTLNNYGLLLDRMGLWAESEAAHSNALTIRTNLHPGDHLHVAFSLNNLASLRASQGDFARAMELHRQTLEMRRRLLGDSAPAVADSIGNLGRIFRQQGRFDDAEAWQNDALTRRRLLEPVGEHPAIATSMAELGLLRRAQGKPAEAAQFLREAFDLRTNALRSDDSTLAESAENLALVLCDLGDFVGAEKLARQSLPIREQNYPDDWRRYHAQALVGRALLGRKEYTEAEASLLAGCNGMKEREARIPVPDKPRLPEALQHLVQLYEATSRPDEAARLRNELT
ncbi:MAG: tetratricopeptide repeat protein [Verrucomicrobia bacterium]|nr:tetratricopeptide repeat protein [Verrucomicrobiota bacterium]